MYYWIVKNNNAYHATHLTHGCTPNGLTNQQNYCWKNLRAGRKGMTCSTSRKHWVTMSTQSYVLTITPMQMIVHIIQEIVIWGTTFARPKKPVELSKFDQHNLKIKLQWWRNPALTPPSTFGHTLLKLTSHQSQMLMSLSTNTSPNQNEAEALSASETWGDAEEFEQTFLWIYQMQWQKEMLAKYGNIMTFFDVTYKTTLYNLALPFIIIWTNAVYMYMITAEFLVNSETNQQIEKLNLLKWYGAIHNGHLMPLYKCGISTGNRAGRDG